MAASPSLSHSSQDKARRQRWIQWCQGVSDECGSGVVRSNLEWLVKDHKSLIQGHNAAISSIDGELAELVGERAAILNQGEPPGCHANDCRDWLPR